MGGARRPTLPKICHTYPAMMKLGTVLPYLTKIRKIYESRDTPLQPLQNFLINMITILTMSAKMVTPGLRKIRVF